VYQNLLRSLDFGVLCACEASLPESLQSNFKYALNVFLGFAGAVSSSSGSAVGLLIADAYI
jgi:hypothetical protein